MNIRIRAARAGEITLSPVQPSGLQQLPESKSYSATGSFGQIHLRQLEGEGISILHHTMQFTQDEELTYTGQGPAIRLHIIMQNSYYFDGKYLGKGVVHERGLHLSTVPDTHTIVKMRAGESYSHLSILYKPEHLVPFEASFPRIEEFLKKAREGRPMIYNTSYCIGGARILSLVDYMLSSHYSGHLQVSYFSTLAKDILMEALLRIAENRSPRTLHISEEAVRRIYKAKRSLLHNMHLPFSLPLLAAEIGLSSFRLTREFKAIYGMGLKEFLLEARMKKAILVLSETDTPVSVVAHDSGYASSQSFSLAFKNYFGCTPGAVHRNGKNTGGRMSPPPPGVE